MKDAAASFAPRAGVSFRLAPDLALVLAPNPSPMTYLGTNSYILGKDKLAIIDPGPDNPDHLAALLDAIAGRPVTHILVTHTHLDHSPLARPLSDAVGALVYAFGNSGAGRSEIMSQLAAEGLTGGGEGIDRTFEPDVILRDGDMIDFPPKPITALHTPGHIGNHLCFRWADVIFTGDHIMGWSTSLVSPPDGDLTDFMRSCDRLQNMPARIYYPGHGASVTDPKARLAWLIAHRRNREAQIIKALADGSATVSTLTKVVYTDVAQGLLPAAERNVFAHLIDLAGRGIVVARPALGVAAEFTILDAAADDQT